ncbi:phage tail protein [Pluralibacter gergoviae]|uniref:phage tail assembly protein T n=1 Tax=Pluralibacter gergoviae TaxID=61647 RepID=UPI0008DC1337|nr:DUF4035 domain-containing protein [Pluralibacter gergoviae]OHY63785.1 phage tail protein [Pluralibacter gergoviae]
MQLMMALALRMGRTLGELQQSMSISEFQMWAEYDRISPVGDIRSDILNAQLVSAVYGSQGGKISIEEAQISWGDGTEEAEEASDPFEALEAALIAAAA